MASACRDTSLGACAVLERAVRALRITCWINKLEASEFGGAYAALRQLKRVNKLHTAAYISD